MINAGPIEVIQSRARSALAPPEFVDKILVSDNDLALPRARDDEMMIALAQFRSATSERVHVEERIHRAFCRVKEALPGLPLRIERLRDTTIDDGDDLRAVQVVARCNARLLVWGWYDPTGFTPRLTADPTAITEADLPSLDEVLRDEADFHRYLFSGLSGDLRTWAMVVLGELLYWSGRFDDALQAIDLAIADWRCRRGREAFLDTQIARGFFYKGVLVCTRKGDVRTAAECFRQVLALRPAAFVSAYNLGDALYQLADYAGAIRAFTTVLGVAGAHYRALVGRGHANYKLGQHREAISDYTAALNLLPSTDVFLARSLAHQALGEPRLALGDYLLAKELDPFVRVSSAHYPEERLFDTHGKDAYQEAEFATSADAPGPGQPSTCSSFKTSSICTLRRFSAAILCSGTATRQRFGRLARPSAMRPRR